MSVWISLYKAVWAVWHTLLSKTSDLAVWDLAEIPIVVKSRHFVERPGFLTTMGISARSHTAKPDVSRTNMSAASTPAYAPDNIMLASVLNRIPSEA